MVEITHVILVGGFVQSFSLKLAVSVTFSPILNMFSGQDYTLYVQVIKLYLSNIMKQAQL